MDEVDLKTIKEDLEYLAEERNRSMILNILVGNHPADIAGIIGSLGKEHRDYIFSLLDTDTASDVLVELDDVAKEKVVAELEHERLSELVDEMDSDDAADIVAELPEELAEKILEAIDKEDSDEVKELLRHEEDTAGGIMALEYVAVNEDETVDEAISEIRVKAEEVGVVYNVYVTSKSGVLVGYLPLQNLILAHAGQRVQEVMERDVISVQTDLDQEEVANIFRRYNVVSLPVVDQNRKLVGRITVDDVVDVMEEEASEDIQKMAGISEEEELKETSVFKISFGRLRWLMVSFSGELCAAFLMYTFRENIERAAFVAFFVPMMMAMGGNVAIQAATVIVRGIALGEWRHGDLFHRVKGEIRVSLLNGSICSALLLSIAFALEGPRFAIVLALSLLAVMLNSAIIGTSVPLIARRLGWDPAIAAGPMITTFNDILGILIYLGVVRAFILHAT